MGTVKKKYNEEFKSKVSLEAVREKLTIEELGHKHSLHPSVIKSWKKQALDNFSLIFTTKNINKTDDVLLENLYSNIGKLKVEVEYLKKKLA